MIHTWFPKSILVEDGICLDHLSKFEIKIKELFEEKGKFRGGMQHVDTLHPVYPYLHHHEEFKPIVDIIHEQSKFYLQQLGYTTAEFYISNMWANISHRGDYLFPHNHGGSILSGAFYVKSNSQNKIKFFNMPDDMMPTPQKFNDLNYKYCEYECNQGRLLMFKSDFMHGTESQTTEEKIVISFNIKFAA
jgi:uncharacterized protein (TIGR02466 family)